MMNLKRIQFYLNSFFWLFLTYLSAPFLYLLIFLLAHLGPKGERGGKNASPKILVIQTGKIGDLVCTTHIFREIKEKFPSAHLTALIISEAKGVLENNPRIDEIILITDYTSISDKFRLLSKLRKEKYDWALNLLPGSFTNIISFWSLVPHRIATTYKYSGEITKFLSIFNNYRLEFKRNFYLPGHYLSLLKFMGIESRSDGKEIFIKPEEEKKAQDFLKEHNLNRNDLLVGMAVTTGVELKTWEPAKFAKLADLLIEKLQAKIIFVGSAKDMAGVANVQKMMQNNSVSAAGFLKLHEVPALLKSLKLFISGDTGPLFIADALGLLVVDIPGPQPVLEQSPRHERSRIVQKDLYCWPCNFGIVSFNYCKEGHRKCIKDVMPEDVFAAAKELIDKYL